MRGKYYLPAALFVLTALQGQTRDVDPIFEPALKEIVSKVSFPIVLPSKLTHFRPGDIKFVHGEVRQDVYFISLYYSEKTSNATYAAGFSGSITTGLPNKRGVKLARGRIGEFRPASCGGSCAPANLWWVQDGIEYGVQIKLRSDMPARDQEKILVEMANSTVTVQRN
jgi:hypothetical protein